MITVRIRVGEKLFEFSSKRDWVNKGPRIWRTHRATNGRAIAIDAQGRICQMGAHFERAERDNAYPVTVYRVDPDAIENGMAMDTSIEAIVGPRALYREG